MAKELMDTRQRDALLAALRGQATPSGHVSALQVQQALQDVAAHRLTVEDSRWLRGETEPSNLPMLLNPIEESEVDFYIQSPDWMAQEKYDGQRCMISVLRAGSVQATNRKGTTILIPQDLARHIGSNVAAGTVLDGELVSNQNGTKSFFAFDMLEFNNQNIRGWPAGQRAARLVEVLSSSYWSVNGEERFRSVYSARTPEIKRHLLDELRAKNAEGIVFKKVDAAYRVGRPNRLGDALKFKFIESASCRVASHNAKSSVELELFHSETQRWVFAGSVTIPPNYSMPPKGAVVEVEYLYARKATGALYQPVYRGERDDIAVMDCKTSQLKYKAGDEDAAETARVAKKNASKIEPPVPLNDGEFRASDWVPDRKMDL